MGQWSSAARAAGLFLAVCAAAPAFARESAPKIGDGASVRVATITIQTDDAGATPALAAPPATPAPAASPPAQATGDAAECEKLAQRVPPFATPDEILAIRQHRDWARAIVVCKAAADADPNSIKLRALLGAAYVGAKDYMSAQRPLMSAADAGDPDAQVNLAIMFANGSGVVKDYFRAVDYLSKAAAANYPIAVTDLGSMYSNGWGVPQDSAKALALFEKGIELGNPFALSQAGVMCFNGKGTPRDYVAAEQYFLQAASLHDGYAMKFLAVLYEHGLVGPADEARADQFRLRAAQEDPDSSTPEVTFPKATVRLTQHATTARRIVYYRWGGGGSYNPAWQAAPGDNRCCPNNMLVCPLGRHWC